MTISTLVVPTHQLGVAPGTLTMNPGQATLDMLGSAVEFASTTDDRSAYKAEDAVCDVRSDRLAAQQTSNGINRERRKESKTETNKQTNKEII